MNSKVRIKYWRRASAVLAIFTVVFIFFVISQGALVNSFSSQDYKQALAACVLDCGLCWDSCIESEVSSDCGNVFSQCVGLCIDDPHEDWCIEEEPGGPMCNPDCSYNGLNGAGGCVGKHVGDSCGLAGREGVCVDALLEQNNCCGCQLLPIENPGPAAPQVDPHTA